MQTHSPIYTEQEIKGFDFSPWGGLEGFLKATSNGATAGNKAMALKRLVPDLSRAVDMTAAAVSSLPFVIQTEDGDTVDSTSDWKNVIGGMPNPRRTIYLLASALCGGAAYLIPYRTPRMIFDLQYAAPHTITPQININGLQYFDRATDQGQVARYNPKEIIYFWLPDSDIEIGPALNTPLSSAMNNAELILNMDNTMRTYGERGFVPITLLGASGMPGGDERKKAESFFDRLLKGGFDVLAKIVNSDKLTLIKVGAGLEELKGSYIEIKREARESVAQSFGIPSALFMSDNAFASEMSALTRQWYMTSKFQSIYQTIEETMTSQLLKPYKLTFSFDLQSMDIFQEDEAARTSALSGIVSAIDTNPSIAILGMSILGYDLDDEQEDMLEEIIKKREENKLDTTPNQQPDTIDATAEDVQEPDPLMEGEDMEEPIKSVSLSPNDIKDLALWQQMATRFFRKGKGMAVDFEAKSLSENIAAPIRLKLANAKNELDIVKAFEIEATQKSDVLALAQAINRMAGNMIKGGEGSGNFGHAGRPGEVGGSASSGFSIESVSSSFDKIQQYNYIGIRGLQEDENYQIGDTARNSRDWDYETDTSSDEELNGTSTLGISRNDYETPEELYKLIVSMSKDISIYGNGRVVLLGGYDQSYGTDPNESVIQNAEVLLIVKNG